MPRYPREELLAAFERYNEARDAASRTGDWNVWAAMFTEDAHYVEHAYGEMHGREAIRDWITKVMAPFLRMTFPQDWWVLDEERGAVVSWTLIDDKGTQRVIDIDGTPPDLKISVSGGDALTVRAIDRRDLLAQAGGAAGGAAAGGELRAAMPGKVVKVLCKVGDVVKPGQGLLVIEAMKMENEVRAATAGKVAAVSVREGQTVEGGQALVSLSSE